MHGKLLHKKKACDHNLTLCTKLTEKTSSKSMLALYLRKNETLTRPLKTSVVT